jgi:hypothetical protein
MAESAERSLAAKGRDYQNLLLTDRAGVRVEDQRADIWGMLEVEQAENRASELVEGKRSQRLPLREGNPVDKAETPIHFDECQARGLVSDRVVGVIRPGPG